ncbi:Uma2 family endonuclease [Streptomyces sp. NPDC003016]
MDAAEALLIVEITSKRNAKDDRTKKCRASARALAPMYVLIDRLDTRGPRVTLFTEPRDGTCKHSGPVPFGETPALPDPFCTTSHTAAFPR